MGTLEVVAIQIVEQVVPENHAPSIGNPSGIALDNGDLMIVAAQLRQGSEI
jgi:hypothetical protein